MNTNAVRNLSRPAVDARFPEAVYAFKQAKYLPTPEEASFYIKDNLLFARVSGTTYSWDESMGIWMLELEL